MDGLKRPDAEDGAKIAYLRGEGSLVEWSKGLTNSAIGQTDNPMIWAIGVLQTKLPKYFCNISVTAQLIST